MLLRWLNRAEEIAIELLLVATTLLVFMDVVLRFGFDTGQCTDFKMHGFYTRRIFGARILFKRVEDAFA